AADLVLRQDAGVLVHLRVVPSDVAALSVRPAHGPRLEGPHTAGVGLDVGGGRVEGGARSRPRLRPDRARDRPRFGRIGGRVVAAGRRAANRTCPARGPRVGGHALLVYLEGYGVTFRNLFTGYD